MSEKYGFWLKFALVFMMVVCAALLAILWSLTRDVSILPQMARTNNTLSLSKNKVSLSLPALVCGLARLDRDPKILLDKKQAQKLVPIVPFLRQALTDKADNVTSEKEVKNVAAVEKMVEQYISDTLTPEQIQHIVKIISTGDLSCTCKSALEQLPLLNKSLRKRCGLPLEEESSFSPVQRSLEKLRFCDLLLGILLIEQERQYRLTPQQVELLVPMQQLIKDLLTRAPETLGTNSVITVQIQLRHLLTVEQQKKLLELTGANFVTKIEVNEEELLRQFSNMLKARQTGSVFLFSLSSLASQSKQAREGPAVIPGELELDLIAALRGVVLSLETSEGLRLEENQVSELSIMAPEIKKSLQNLKEGKKDESLPELQTRVLAMLKPEQITYILEHKNDMTVQLQSADGEEPIARELQRFLDAREKGEVYEPQGASQQKTIQSTKPKSQKKPSVSQNAAAKADFKLPNLVVGILVNLENEESISLDKNQISDLYSIAPAVKDALVSLSYGTEDSRTEEVKGMLKRILYPQQIAYLTSCNISASNTADKNGENIISSELSRFLEAKILGLPYTVSSDLPHSSVNASNQSSNSNTPIAVPMEAIVRGILFTLESNPQQRLTVSQVGKIQDNLTEYKQALDSLNENSSNRTEKIMNWTQSLYGILTSSQRRYLLANEKKSRIALNPSQFESPLARELESFVKARLSKRQYNPSLAQ